MATINWASATSGNWSSANNWSPGTVPGSGDTAYIGVTGGTYTSTVDVATSVYLLWIQSSNAIVNINADLTLGAGGLNFTFGLLLVNARINVNSSIQLSNDARISLGSAGTLGHAPISASGTPAIVATTTNSIANNISVSSNNGIIFDAVSGATFFLNGQLNVAATTSNGIHGASNVVFGEAGYTGTVNYAPGSASTVSSIQTVLTIGCGTLQIGNAIAASDLQNFSRWNISTGGTLDLLGHSVSISSLTGAGNIINTSGVGGLTLASGSLGGAISGVLNLNISGNVTLSGASTFTGVTLLSSGSLTLGSSGSLGLSTVSYSGNAELIAAGLITFTNNITVQSGVTAYLEAATGYNLVVAGSVTLSGSSDVLVLGGARGISANLGAVSFSSTGNIRNFSGADKIYILNAAYSSSDKIVWQSTANGIQTFAVVDGANTIIQSFNLYGHYGANEFTVSSDPSSEIVVGLKRNATPLPDANDFSGNGSSDILLESAATGGFVGTWTMDSGSPVWHPYAQEAAGWHAAGLGDFNGDGVSDVLLENAATGQIGAWTISNNAPSWVSFSTEAAGWHAAGVGDFNGDGNADVLLENSSTGQIGAWLINNNTPTWAGFSSEASGWHAAGVGDFNGDGNADVLLENSSTGQIGAWLISNNLPTWVGFSTEASGWHAAGVGDFNSDGISDVLLENVTTGQIGVWLINNNLPTWHYFSTEASGWHVADVGDYNGNGVSDVLLANAATGQVGEWLISNLTPTWQGISTMAPGWHAVA